MFSEKGSRHTGEQSENPEQLDLERQKKKLIGFYAHGGDERYIFNSNEEQFSEDNLTREDKENTRKALQDNAHWKDRKRKLLMHIAGPDYWYSGDEIFDKMAGDKHQKRILGYTTGVEWNICDSTSGKNVEDFLQRYPTPIDFEQVSEEFLKKIRDNNDELKTREYIEAMEEFQLGVYGKKYEYYKAMQELQKDVTEGSTEINQRRTKNGKFMQKFFEIFDKDRLVEDSGLAMFNKGSLIEKPNRKNEDAAYYNPVTGLFGVFDGAGGERGAARASELARDTMVHTASQRDLRTPYELGQVLVAANEALVNDRSAGYSTAVVGRILKKQGQKTLIWASVGDSRIYIVRKGVEEAIQITKDEIYGEYRNVIRNGLGTKNFKMQQTGEFTLKDGDRVVFCSDGVTGDYEPDLILDDEFADIVKGAETADLAAWRLINRATKRDDRTAIVVEV